ncbi:MAG: hypothetical protein NXH91_02130 [Phyllobacteriaceae bacterium]|jgi:hypothetical protein|nr:hypothetical protein [Phyllobacteriaceae bacterium]
MLFRLLRAYAVWFAVSSLVCLLGVVTTLILNANQVSEFLKSYIYHWDGLLVAASGYGALHFAVSTHKQQFHSLIMGVLDAHDDLKLQLSTELEQLYSFRNKQVIAAPVFLVGMAVLYMCGYPMTGFPKYYLWLASSAMFYAGGLMLAYGLYALRIFHTLEENVDQVDLQDNVNIVELENFHFYLSILFLTAIVALYFAFRGTLTANFTFTPPHPWIGSVVNLFLAPGGDYSSVRNLLLYPIVLFLPLALFASFYMKLVLRKIYLASIKRKVDEIDTLTRPIIEDADTSGTEVRIIEVRKLALELKEKIIQNNKVLPLITLKDTPSIALIIIVILQFVWINDGQISGFFGNLVGAS